MANIIPVHTLRLFPGADHFFRGPHAGVCLRPCSAAPEPCTLPRGLTAGTARNVTHPLDRLVDVITDWLATGSRAGRLARLDRAYKSISLPRFVALQGVKNCRDLGGYPTTDGFIVRPRRLFRAGEYGHQKARPRPIALHTGGGVLTRLGRLARRAHKQTR